MKKFLKILAVGALGGVSTIVPDAVGVIENKKLAEAILVATIAAKLYTQTPPQSSAKSKK